MDQLEDLILTSAHVSAADRAAWRRWAANPPSLRGGRRKKRKRRKKKLPKTSSARSSSPMHGSPAQFLVVDVPVLMQRRLGWSLRRFAWLDSGYMFCDSLVLLLEVFHSFSTCSWRLGSWSRLSSCSSWFSSRNTWFDSGYLYCVSFLRGSEEFPYFLRLGDLVS